MNLITQIRGLYGDPVVKSIRSWEKQEKKLAKLNNHLVFSLRCKKEDITPKFLRIKAPSNLIRNTKNKDIIKNAEKKLLRENIRQVTNKIYHTKKALDNEKTLCKLAILSPASLIHPNNETQNNNNNISHLECQGQASESNSETENSVANHASENEADSETKNTATNHVTWERLCDLITGSKELKHAQSKKQQCRKLENLKVEQEQKENARNQLDLSGTQLKKWVINLSKYSLTKNEENVLGKGLGFAPNPQKSHLIK